MFLCAKTKPALDALSGQFQAKTVRRKFLALAVVLPPEEAMKVVDPVRAPEGGLPAEFTVELALGPDPHQVGRMRVFRKRGGLPSVSEFTVLEPFGRFAWIECRPLTGPAAPGAPAPRRDRGPGPQRSDLRRSGGEAAALRAQAPVQGPRP